MNSHPEYITRIYNNTPSNPESWNNLCFTNANLQQSTYIDHAHELFAQWPVFFEVWSESKLVGGVKFFRYQPKRNAILAALGSHIQQAGEIVVDLSCDRSIITREIVNEVRKYVEENKIVSASQLGFYYDNALIPVISDSNIINKTNYMINYIDLEKDEISLQNSLNSSHKRNIKYALRHQLKFRESFNFDDFLDLIQETYRNQSIKGPDNAYLLCLYNDLKKIQIVKIFMVDHQEIPIVAAFITFFGDTAYYSFGGTRKNDLCAGHLLHWQIILECKRLGLKRYCFGQVTAGYENDSAKFAKGISQFKRRFGGLEVPSAMTTYVFNKPKYFLWKMILKLTGKS